MLLKLYMRKDELAKGQDLIGTESPKISCGGNKFIFLSLSLSVERTIHSPSN